jgi:hypothetical protein
MNIKLMPEPLSWDEAVAAQDAEWRLPDLARLKVLMASRALGGTLALTEHSGVMRSETFWSASVLEHATGQLAWSACILGGDVWEGDNDHDPEPTSHRLRVRLVAAAEH